ncbi:MAG: holo-ACP synthase [Pseudomonadota bacterium]|nr:holo-ACP synthase [Pseudomonadota bacterium]MEC7830183.1 holo-ACP synthase [Pseudomonadota bacterium]MEC9382700.1 holo-ACP synthase [Pseudomonadota bacterium]
MIIGIGNDLINIERIEKTLSRFGNRFINRVFTEVEILKSEKRFKRAASYAKRFAAKEAVTKALGTGLSNGVYLKDIGVVNNKYGKPSINLTGGAKKRLKKLLPPKHKAKINITITDDFPWAQAFIIIEAINEND